MIAILLLPLAVAAQTKTTMPARTPDVAGTVIDSTSGRGVPGAYVEVPDVHASGVADSLGAFTLSGFASGVHTFLIYTKAFDRLGTFSARVVTVNGTPITLRVPSEELLVRTVCNSTDAGLGMISGTVTGERSPRGAPVTVVASWPARDARKNATTPRNEVRTQADSAGAFWLCDVPLSTAIGIEALTDSARATKTTVSVDDGRMANATLELHALRFDAILTGTVRGDATVGSTVVAEVALPDLGRAQFSEPDGSFRIANLPSGIQHVVVRRLGFTPLDTVIPLSAEAATTLSVRLARVTLLDSMKVTAQRRIVGAGLAAFEERRKLGFGFFLDSTLLRAQEHHSVLDLLRGHPSVSGQSSARGPKKIIGGGSCVLNVFLDGVLVPQFDLAKDIAVHELEAMEVYVGAAETPSEFTRLGANCGAIVLWTRR